MAGAGGTVTAAGDLTAVMRTVEDRSGRRYLLLKRARDASLVRDRETGERRHLPNEHLSPVEGVSPLETAAASLPGAARALASAVHDDRTLGLLVALESADGLTARALLDADEHCESDLHGQLAELRAAGLVEAATVDGEEGYRLADDAAATIRAIQSATSSG